MNARRHLSKISSMLSLAFVMDINTRKLEIMENEKEFDSLESNEFTKRKNISHLETSGFSSKKNLKEKYL